MLFALSIFEEDLHSMFECNQLLPVLTTHLYDSVGLSCPDKHLMYVFHLDTICVSQFNITGQGEMLMIGITRHIQFLTRKAYITF
ncbi:hypothetical protein DPMN_140062 [Dreissena polymorpha]|uniref:Uncharacterized protein n=1 Tax=Dreissena polymorpha TaxID=45954 RepID=A0A9D4GAT4_DREPO|nr:hypothetical protein DPMN_140062 [Dreissena polymorpha]